MRYTINIDKDRLQKIESGAHRQALIDLGMYSIPTHKVHKNKKAYTRKTKHRNNGN